MASDPDKTFDLDKDADTFWDDYAKLSDGLTVPLGSVAPLIDAVRLLIRDWDRLVTMPPEERQGWLNQLAVAYNHAAESIDGGACANEITWSDNKRRLVLASLGKEILRKRAILEIERAGLEVERLCEPIKPHMRVEAMEADLAEMISDGPIRVRIVDEQNGKFGVEFVTQTRARKTLTGLPRADVERAVAVLFENRRAIVARLLKPTEPDSEPDPEQVSGEPTPTP